MQVKHCLRIRSLLVINQKLNPDKTITLIFRFNKHLEIPFRFSRLKRFICKSSQLHRANQNMFCIKSFKIIILRNEITTTTESFGYDNYNSKMWEKQKSFFVNYLISVVLYITFPQSLLCTACNFLGLWYERTVSTSKLMTYHCQVRTVKIPVLTFNF